MNTQWPPDEYLKKREETVIAMQEAFSTIFPSILIQESSKEAIDKAIEKTISFIEEVVWKGYKEDFIPMKGNMVNGQDEKTILDGIVEDVKRIVSREIYQLYTSNSITEMKL